MSTHDPLPHEPPKPPPDPPPDPPREPDPVHHPRPDGEPSGDPPPPPPHTRANATVGEKRPHLWPPRFPARAATYTSSAFG